MTVPAWEILAGLPAWQVTQIPRPAVPGDNADPGTAPDRTRDAPGDRERGQRMRSLASAARSGSSAAFGWIRDTASGPVTVITAGHGMSSGDDGSTGAATADPVPLGYPAGGLGRPLPPGGLAEALAALRCWVPVAITPDALLAELHDGGMPLEEGLRSWRRPFGWIVIASPVDKDRHKELTSEASLAQLMAERHDSPRAQQAAQRSRARHDELRQAATIGLWDIWLLAGAAAPAAAARVAGLLCASLDLKGLPFGLTEQDRCQPLPDLLGALPADAAAPDPGPLAQDVLGMFGGQAPRPRDTPPEPTAVSEDFVPPRWTPKPRPEPAPRPAPRQAPQQRAQPDSGSPGWTPATWAPQRASGWGSDGQPTWSAVPEPLPQEAAGRGQASRAAGNGLAADFPDPEPQFPCAASSRLLAALAVPPATEIPGIRMVLEPSFDVTPETAGTAGEAGATAGGSAQARRDDSIGLGMVLDSAGVPSWPMTVPRSSLNRHTFICGATGSGKSQTTRHLLESATAAGIPWLVIEPAKAEYRLMAGRLPDTEVTVIRPGDLSAVPAGMNPLEPSAGPDGTRFPLQAHADLVRALFLAAFQADEPFPQVLASALTRVYAEAGWDMITGEAKTPGAAYPTLIDLQATALRVVKDIGYGQEVTDNVKGFVSVRIGSLTGGTTGRFLHGAFPLDYSRLLAGNVVLEIEDCGDDTDRAFLTGAVLIRLTEYLRMRSRAEGPRSPGLLHLTVIEEAHRLLRQPPAGEGSGPAAHAVEMFAGLLAEIRAYGEGLVIAEQIPSKLLPDAMKNTAVKLVHRLPAKDDRDTVGATMNLTESQSRYLVTLKPGEAAVFTDGMDYPVLVRMPDGTEREIAAPACLETAGSLVTGRSTACPAGCAGDPCTLERIADAQKTLDADPEIALWAELTAAAHLAGWPSPRPPGPVLARLAGMEPRLRDCTLAHAIDGAVAARIPSFSARVAPAALAAHLADVLRGVLDHGREPCDAGEPRWHAPATVRSRNHGPGTEGAALLGRVPPLRDAVLGTRSPGALEKAAGCWADDPDFAGRLSLALARFPDGDTYAAGVADTMAGTAP